MRSRTGKNHASTIELQLHKPDEENMQEVTSLSSACTSSGGVVRRSADHPRVGMSVRHRHFLKEAM